MADKKTGKIRREETGEKRWMIFRDDLKNDKGVSVKEFSLVKTLNQMKDMSEIQVEFELKSGQPNQQTLKILATEKLVEAQAKAEAQDRKIEQNRQKLEDEFVKPKEPEKPAGNPINTNYPKDFHNPYNFVPTIPRESITGELADREPIGHDRFYPNHLSGKLTVKMTVETPLVVLDTAKMSLSASDPKHKQFPVRIENGKPFINPTAVKGMLRSAYEAVTNSRLSVFTKHDDRLAFRAEVGEGLFAIPARIEGEKENEKIVLYTGNSEIDENDGGPKITGYKKNGQPIRQSQFGAWIETYKKRAYEVVNGKKVFTYSNYAVVPEDDNNNLPKHGKKAWAWIEFDDSKRERFTFYKVIKLAYEENQLGEKPNENCEKFEGFICLTGKNMANKHDERFFFNPTTEIKLEKKHRDSWDSLIKNYRKQHESDFDSPPTDGKGRDEYSLEWSRQIYRTTKEEISEKAKLVAEELKNETLCYAKVKKVGTEFEVLELFPVMISRRLHEVSPDSLIDENLKPTSIIENVKNQDGTIKYKSEMSPADRVFGFVRHKRKDKDGKDVQFKGKIAGYRGQVRFGSVKCKGLLVDDGKGNKILNPNGKTIQEFNNLPLNILGQPKPQQGRFYVAEDDKGKAQTHQRNNEDAGYKKSEGRGLRGRKVYPHHASLPTDYWQNPMDANLTTANPKFFKEYRRPPKAGQEQRDSQNRSIQGWIKSNTEFEFDIHFTNLSEVELGALVWLLDLPLEHFHRFGGGKPLGFGSVKLDLDLTKSEIYNGKELEKRYKSLDDVSMTKTDAKTCKTKFEYAVKSSYPNSNFLASFLRACEGFTNTNLPIHYPRARRYKEDRDRNKTWIGSNNEELTSKPIVVAPHSEGLAYEWFVANNKMERGELKNAYVLKNIAEDDGLPILEHRK